MFRFLIDTSVWLDLAKDTEQQPLLGVLEELIRTGEISLIVPRTVLDEFQRNKARVVEEGRRSLSSVFKRVKEAVDKFGDPKRKRAVLAHLNDVDHRLPQMGEAAVAAVTRIEKLLTGGTVLQATPEIKLRAAQRAIDNRAPFHRQKNSMADALIIETYAECLNEPPSGRTRFMLVTHNTKDFSDPKGNDRVPHPDLAPLFSRIRSQYYIRLGEGLKRVQPGLVSDLMLEQEWHQEPRSLSEVVAAINELFDKVWYNRHQNARIKLERGTIKLVDKETFPVLDHDTRPMQRDVWKLAQRAARRMEKKHGKENLGPWSDFEWGMLNGKLSALRWVLGDEWDFLDT